MLIENKGIKTNSFYIPSFVLNKGEIIILNLHNGKHFYSTEMLLKDIFSGKTINENVVVNKKLTFVEHFIEPKLRRLFYSITVGEYLKMNADLNSPYATKIYEIGWINEKTKVNTLPGNPKRLLSLYTTLSKTSNIIFDLVGQDSKGAEETYEIVKEAVKNGGSAILLNCFENMKNDSAKYIELQWMQ
jgi:ABC-type multidrug transport system ATPase subunit